MDWVLKRRSGLVTWVGNLHLAMMTNGHRSEFDISRMIVLIEYTQTENPVISRIMNGFQCQHLSW